MALKITLCMIVKNEEAVLERCLKSARGGVDEIVVADTGSTDKTKEIARRYTQNVYDYPWTDDFAAARNFSFSKATGDYLLWLDADDVIDEENLERLRALKTRLSALSPAEQPDAVMCKYENYDENGQSVCAYYRERLLKRSSHPVWKGCVHECIEPNGKIEYAAFRIKHCPENKTRGNRNLEIYRKNIARGYALSPRDKFYYGRELYYNGFYSEAAEILRDFLGEHSGWYVNKIEACKILGFSLYSCGESERAKSALFNSFLYGEPRAGICVTLGNFFKSEEKYADAIFWYESALRCSDHTSEGDFDSPSDRSLVPLLELTYCYYQAGETDKAVACHRRALSLAPDHPSVKHNQAFFKIKNLV